MNVDPQATIFLDTNILVYAYDRSAGQKHVRAAELVEACGENENGCLGCKQIQSKDLNHSLVYGRVQVVNPFKEIY